MAGTNDPRAAPSALPKAPFGPTPSLETSTFETFETSETSETV